MPIIDIVLAVTVGVLGAMYAYRRYSDPAAGARSVSDYGRSLRVLGTLSKNRPAEVADLSEAEPATEEPLPEAEAIEGILHPVPPLRPKKAARPSARPEGPWRARGDVSPVPIARPATPSRPASPPASPLPPAGGAPEPAAAWSATDGRTVADVAPLAGPAAEASSERKTTDSPLAPIAAQLRDEARLRAFPEAVTPPTGAAAASETTSVSAALPQQAPPRRPVAGPEPGRGKDSGSGSWQLDLRDSATDAGARPQERAVRPEQTGQANAGPAVADETPEDFDLLTEGGDPASAEGLPDEGAGAGVGLPAGAWRRARRPEAGAARPRPTRATVSADAAAIDAAPARRRREPESSLRSQLRDPSLLVPAGVALAAVAVTAVVLSLPGGKPQPSSPSRPSAKPASAAPQPLQATSVTGGTLGYAVGSANFVVVVRDQGSGPCWLEEMASPTSPVIWSGMMYPGQVRVMPSVGGSLWVRAGDPVNISLTVGGRAVAFSPAGGVPLNFYFRHP